MRTEKDVEAYLLRSNRRYRVLEGRQTPRRTFLVDSGGEKPPVAVLVDAPLVVLRAHVGDIVDLPAADEAALFRNLLELNARHLVHASYGIEDSHVVLSSALELENLDFNEIQATLDEIDVALAHRFPLLRQTLPQVPPQTAEGGLPTRSG